MFYYLVTSLKQRLILELRDYFQEHPIYNKIVPYIQGQFAYEERPQAGMIVTHSSTSKVNFSADDFIGTLNSHVMLAYVDKPVYPIEWVREDSAAINHNNNTFPTPPGIYYLEILKAPTRQQECGSFIIDPLLTVFDEVVLVSKGDLNDVGVLAHRPAQRKVRLYKNKKYLLQENISYTIDFNTGKITFIEPLIAGDVVTAEYRYIIPSIGPVDYRWNNSDQTTLPGVILAFGKRSKKGDKVAIVTYPDRAVVGNAYGGKNDLQFEISIFVNNDLNAVNEITDIAYMFLNTIKKHDFGTEGIEVVEASMGGEATDVYDDKADTTYFTTTLSVTLRADWEIHVPLPFTIYRATPDPLSGVTAVGEPLILVDKKYFPFKFSDYERIK